MAQSHEKAPKVTRKLINQQTNDQADRSCPICLEVFNKQRCREAFTTCGHSFCEICLQRALKIKLYCPICRQYQQQDKDNDQHTQPIQLDQNIPWDPQVVRAFYGPEVTNEDGRQMRTVQLSDGESTNIHVDRNCKLNVSGAIIVNGKRIQNPSDCNQQ